MKQFEVGDVIKYLVFYKGFIVKKDGIIASERKMSFSPDLGHGYSVLNEENEIVWVWERDIVDYE